jgi:hypothetical protein
MNEVEIQQWVLRRLGAPFLKVELCEDHLKDAVEEARRWFAAKKGMRYQMIMRVYSNTTEYPLPDEVDTVTDVAFPVPPMDLSLIFSPYILLDEKVPYDVFAAPSSIGLYSSFTQTLQYVEVAKRILGAEPEWLQRDRTLYLFPPPRQDVGVWVEYKPHKVCIDKLNERDHEILKRYVLAAAKRDLGRIRSKYSTYPSAQGEVSLDGERLLEEATTEFEALNNELAQSAYPMGFITG